MKNLPRKLKIGGHNVEVDYSQELDDANGDSDYKLNEIRISKGLSRTQKESTLIHEIFHFLNTTLGDETVGHALLDSLSEQFYQVLSDNRLLR